MANVTATLSAANSDPVTVTLEFSGTATPSDDYTVSSSEIVIGPGALTGSIAISSAPDEIDEVDETVIVDIASVVNGVESGTQQQTVTISDDDDPLSLRVTSLVPNSAGFVAQFSNDLDVEQLNLYATVALGPADLSVVGAGSGPVAGSFSVDAAGRVLSFIKTGAPLAADTYTVTFRSADDAFESTSGLLLDGDGMGPVAHDYVNEFVLGVVEGARVIGLPDFVRGPGQAVNVPADALGLPVTISDGTAVRNVNFEINYDPALLEITGASTGAAMPEGAEVTIDTTTTPGTAVVMFTSPVDLPAGENTLVNLEANVPTDNANDIYRLKQILDIHSIAITDGDDAVILGADDDAFHVVEFFADVSGNSRVNAADASQIAQVAALLDDGFRGAAAADPSIIGDISGNGRLNAADASRAAQHAALIPVAEIPEVPVGVVTSPTTLGPDPKLSVGSAEGAPGATVSVPIEIDSIEDLQAPNGVIGVTIVLDYDESVLTPTGVTNGDFLSRPGWQLTPNLNIPGTVVLVAFSTSPVEGTFVESFAEVQFEIAGDAPAGATPVNLVPSFGPALTEISDEDGNTLVLIPAPTAAADDEVDGSITVLGPAGPTVTLSADPTEIAENGGSSTITATLSEAAAADVTVSLTYSGEATDPDDYTASASEIVIAQGSLTGTATVTAVDDDLNDDDESIVAEITGVSPGASESGDQSVSILILDDDEAGQEPGNRITIPRDLTAEPGGTVDVPVNIELANITAGNGITGLGVVVGYDSSVLTLDDTTTGSFFSGNGWNVTANTNIADTVIFVGFTTQPLEAASFNEVLSTLNFTVAADAPAGETVINLLAGTGPALTELLDVNDNSLTLASPVSNDPTDDADGIVNVIVEVGPTVGLSVDNSEINESAGESTATITATLSEVLTEDVVVNLNFGGTATAGEDYDSSGSEITIAAGQTTGTVSVTVIDDDVDDDNETIEVSLGEITGAGAGAENQVDILIIDDDEPVVLPTISLSVDPDSIAEDGGSSTITATASEALTEAATVTLGFGGTATDGDDYNASGTEIVIGAGETSGSVTVTAVNDDADEPDESIDVEIVSVSGGANENGEQTASVTILDDDEPVQEPGNRITIPRDLTAEPGGTVDVPVNIELADITAGNGITGLGVVVGYDSSVLTLDDTTTGSFFSGNGWNVTANTNIADTVIFVGFTTQPLEAASFNEVLSTLNFTVAADAPAGETVINLLAGTGPALTELLDVNDNSLTLASPVSNDPTDDADGIVNVIVEVGPTVGLSVDNSEINESAGESTATITATLSEVLTEDVVVNLNFGGTATAGEDYDSSGSEITIAAGQTTGTVSVTVIDDDVDDDNETIEVSLGEITGAGAGAENQVDILIIDDDEPVVLPTISLSVDPDSIAEDGGSSTITATASEALTEAATVTLGFGGTATDGDDYNASGTEIVIGAGETSGSVTVTAVNDDADEPDESIDVEIVSVSGGANENGEQTASVTILDDDEPVQEPGNRITIPRDLTAEPGGTVDVPVNIELADITAGNGITGLGVVVGYDSSVLTLDDTTTGTFFSGNGWNVTANTNIADTVIFVGFTTQPLEAASFNEVLSTLNFTVAADAPAGETVINLLAGTGPALTELLDVNDNSLTLASPVSNDPTDDADGIVNVIVEVGRTVGLSVDNSEINESAGESTATITATLSEVLTEDVVVNLNFGGTATAGEDYDSSGSEITIAAGQTTGTVSVTVIDDDVDDDNETIEVSLGEITGAGAGAENQVDILIIDDDEAVIPTISLGIDPVEIAEDGTATITATASSAVSADTTISLGFGGTATGGDDYNAPDEIVIAAGATTGVATLVAVDDDADEPDETVEVELLAINGPATELDEQTGTITIIDNDDPVEPEVTLSIDPDQIPENGGQATITATLSEVTTVDVTIELGFTGTAAAGADYNASASEIVIAAGSTSGTVTIDSIDDDDDEPDETVVADITSVTNGTGSGAVVTTILDDDEGALVTLSVADGSILEAEGSTTVTVTLSQEATEDVVVDLAYSGDATRDVDYTASADQVTIAAGSTTATVTITAIQDDVEEVNELVNVDITTVAGGGALEDGDQQVSVIIVDDDGDVNEAPVLENPGPQSLAETQDTLEITLVATDPDLDPLTYDAVVESAEFFYDQTLDLNFVGDLFENFSEADSGGRVALQEKWLLGGDGRTWYYIVPSGDFYRWLGGGVLNRELVARLSTEAYDDPSLLYDATPDGIQPPVTVSLDGNVLTLDPADGFVGAFSINASANDGELTDSQSFLVNVEPNVAPTIINPGDQALPTNQDTLDVTLEAVDPMNDPITFAAEVQSIEYFLDQTIGFQLGPNGIENNWSGSVGENWVLSDDGETWYFITPGEMLYRWNGGDRDILADGASEFVANLSAGTHADPARLYDAQAGQLGDPVANVSIDGDVLTIDPNPGFVGTFGVLLTATDVGGLSDSTLIRVDVTAAPAGALQIRLNTNVDLEDRVAGRPAAEALDLGFVENDRPVIADPNEDLLNDVLDNNGTSEAAFEQLLDENLIHEDLAEKLASDFLTL